MDTSTYEILKECNSGCRMAVNSIEQLVAYLKNQELQELSLIHISEPTRRS